METQRKKGVFASNWMKCIQKKFYSSPNAGNDSLIFEGLFLTTLADYAEYGASSWPGMDTGGIGAGTSGKENWPDWISSARLQIRRDREKRILLILPDRKTPVRLEERVIPMPNYACARHLRKWLFLKSFRTACQI